MVQDYLWFQVPNAVPGLCPHKKRRHDCVCVLATWTPSHRETGIPVFEIPFSPASLEELFLVLFSVTRTWKCGTDPRFPTRTLSSIPLRVSGTFSPPLPVPFRQERFLCQRHCPFALLVSAVNTEAMRTPSSAHRDLSKQLSTQDS